MVEIYVLMYENGKVRHAGTTIRRREDKGE
jgi:hypothetical protein